MAAQTNEKWQKHSISPENQYITFADVEIVFVSVSSELNTRRHNNCHFAMRTQHKIFPRFDSSLAHPSLHHVQVIFLFLFLSRSLESISATASWRDSQCFRNPNPESAHCFITFFTHSHVSQCDVSRLWIYSIELQWIRFPMTVKFIKLRRPIIIVGVYEPLHIGWSLVWVWDNSPGDSCERECERAREGQ